MTDGQRLEDEAYTALLDAALGREKCTYDVERRLVYLQISALVGVVCADVCSLYGVGHGPSGAFDHYAAELRKVLGWYAELLINRAPAWSGSPLRNPRDRSRIRWVQCGEIQSVLEI